MPTITNSDNTIDSRDIIERISELQGELESLQENVDDAEGEDDVATAKEDLSDWQEENQEELDNLKSLAEDAEDYCEDWEFGATLINESYFINYCQELVSDIGDMPREIPSYIVIDWEATAENLMVDYTAVDFGDTTYYVR